MVKHLLAAIAVTLAASLLVSLGYAAPAAPAAPAATAARTPLSPKRTRPATVQEQGSIQQVRAKVKEIDRGKQRLTLEAKPDPLILDIDRATTIFIDGRIATLAEIKAGMEVQAAWESRRGANRAQWVEVRSRPSHQPSPEPPAPPPAPTP
jgi:hypothetical protein